ncbi:MAG: hypothetical protein P4M04_17115 [Acidobacteriota bacterium]|nr:hypothetical protein [Acidobacteriota bacterium]
MPSILPCVLATSDSLLAEGKITSEDAERLLDKLAAVKEPVDNAASAQPEATAADAKSRKYLRIVVGNDAGKDVNMRVPLSFLRSGVGLIGVLPPRVTQKLSDKGFNLEALSGLQGDKLNQVLNELCVDIDSDDDKHVHIFCE